MTILNYPFIIANADDLGLNSTVNSAIVQCFKRGYINSASIMTNSPVFNDTVSLIEGEPEVKNLGVHIDLVEFRPLTEFEDKQLLNQAGYWNLNPANSKLKFLKKGAKQIIENEIYAQIEKAISAGLNPIHLDSHYHMHTLPGFQALFIKAAKKYKLKLRLAQSYNEGNYLKFLYRKWLNSKIKKGGYYYSDQFVDVMRFISLKGGVEANVSFEIMLHPDLDTAGNLTDHYDPQSMVKWLECLKHKKAI